MVFLRLPLRASADGAMLIAWAVEAGTGAGSQVEIPLIGDQPTRCALLWRGLANCSIIVCATT